MLSQEFIGQMKTRLLEEKGRLEEELFGLKPHTEMGDDPEDDAPLEREVDEVSRDVMSRIKVDLAKIEKALAKIDAGTYGTDDEGVEISQEQLEANPQADKAL